MQANKPAIAAICLLFAISIIALVLRSDDRRIVQSPDRASAHTTATQPELLNPIEWDITARPAATEAAAPAPNDDAPAFECVPDAEKAPLDLSAVASQLAQSSDPDHLLMVGLISGKASAPQAIQAMTSALRSDTDNPLILWHFLETCARSPELPICADNAIEARAVEADGSNGRLWSRIAGYRLQQGDASGALRALNQAVVAPRFTHYRMAHIDLFERGLAAAGIAQYGDRMMQAFGIQAALVSPEFRTVSACTEKALESLEWRTVCLKLGQRWTRDGKDAHSTLVGIDLQKRLHESAGEDEQAAQLQRERDALGRYATHAPAVDSLTVLTRDERVLEQYLNEMRAFGEIPAMDYLHDEITRLKAVDGYDPCKL